MALWREARLIPSLWRTRPIRSGLGCHKDRTLRALCATRTERIGLVAPKDTSNGLVAPGTTTVLALWPPGPKSRLPGTPIPSPVATGMDSVLREGAGSAAGGGHLATPKRHVRHDIWCLGLACDLDMVFPAAGSAGHPGPWRQQGTRCESGTAPQRSVGTTAVKQHWA